MAGPPWFMADDASGIMWRANPGRKRAIMAGQCKRVPRFKTELAERHFWETHDSADYLDWSKAERVRLPNLKPSTTAISLRLPVPLLERIKVAANKRDVPYRSLIKTWLAEKLERA